MILNGFNNKHYLAFPILLALLSGGCTPAQNRDISGDLTLGKTFSSDELFQEDSAVSAATANQAYAGKNGWWTLYEDETLNTLMQSAFQDNPDLNQTRARLAQTAALAKKSASAFWPQATITGSRETVNGDTASPSDVSLTGAASFEFDLWGKNRATFKASDLQTQASAETLKAATITLSASIVENWLQILAAREEEALVRKQLDINTTILDLQTRRFSLGTATALDVLQQKEALVRSQSLLPEIHARQNELKNNVSVLIGRSPTTHTFEVTSSKLPAPLPLPHNGVPSSLLASRPDIIAAWLELQASDWATQAAIADRLPNFTLFATYTTTATALDALLNTWLLNMAADIAIPIIDGGNRRAEVWHKQALADERYHAYRETILNAVADVENALSKNHYQNKELVALNDELEAARNTLEQAQISYINGNQSYINVLTSLNNVYKLEQQIVQEHLNLNLYRVALYRALGGQSWVNSAALKKREAA